MNPLLQPLSAYFAADTPELRASALAVLVDAYRRVRNAPEPETVALAPSDLARLRTLAEQARFDSVEALLAAIAAAPPLLDQIRSFLAAPVIEPSGDRGLPDIIIRPESPRTCTIARISIGIDRVTVLFPEKRDDFREIVKGDYSWDEPHWFKRVEGWHKAANAAAELGHRLLGAGFWIAPPTPEVQDMIVGESFEPEIRRKIMRRNEGQYDGWLVLWWARTEDCYDAAKRISGSRYDKPVVVVPPEYYDEVEDFAARYGFQISPAAQGVIDRARAALNAALLVRVETDKESEQANSKPPVLAVPENPGIADELADEPL